MNKNKSREDEIWNDLYPRMGLLIKKDCWEWESVVAASAFGVGVLSFVAGTILTIAAWFVSPGNLYQYFKVASIICFAINLPLFALGAHCLDLLEKKLPFLREVGARKRAWETEIELPKKPKNYAIRQI